MGNRSVEYMRGRDAAMSRGTRDFLSIDSDYHAGFDAGQNLIRERVDTDREEKRESEAREAHSEKLREQRPSEIGSAGGITDSLSEMVMDVVSPYAWLGALPGFVIGLAFGYQTGIGAAAMGGLLGAIIGWMIVHLVLWAAGMALIAIIVIGPIALVIFGLYALWNVKPGEKPKWQPSTAISHAVWPQPSAPPTGLDQRLSDQVAKPPATLNYEKSLRQGPATPSDQAGYKRCADTATSCVRACSDNDVCEQACMKTFSACKAVFPESARTTTDPAPSETQPPQDSMAPAQSTALALSPLPENSAPTRPSFDCAGAKSGAARLICSDQELMAIDATLGTTFGDRKARTITVQDREDFVKAQVALIRDRNRKCGLEDNSKASTEELRAAKPCILTEIKRRLNDLGYGVR